MRERRNGLCQLWRLASRFFGGLYSGGTAACSRCCGYRRSRFFITLALKDAPEGGIAAIWSRTVAAMKRRNDAFVTLETRTPGGK